MKLAALALVTTLGLAGTAGADPVRPRPRGQFRQLLLERFDANHDGQLDPQERHRAARVLRRMARKLALEDRGQARRAHRAHRRVDGVAAPGSVPPAAQPQSPEAADAWLDNNEP